MSTTWQGNLIKMAVRHETPVSYALRDAREQSSPVEISSMLGAELRVEYDGVIECIHCSRRTRKPYGEGSCFPCFQSRPENDICIVKPELCHFDEAGNPCRDQQWGLDHCFIDHVLYVAVSSGLKVGITRHTQIPTRWIDQGASRAMPVLKLPNRHAVGLIEKQLSEHFSDRTQWQRMLKHQVAEVDLEEAAGRVIELAGSNDGVSVIERRSQYEFEYPHLRWPEKVKSINLSKTPEVRGELIAIKGQYLLLDSGVLNVRKHSGFQVRISLD